MAAYFVSLLIVAAIDPWKLPFPLLYGLAGWIYARRIGSVRLKDLPGAKTIIVAGVTAICFAGLVGGPLWLYALEFLLISIDTILFDIRDLRGDALNGVRSIPVLLGREKTLFLLAVLDGLLALIYWPAAAYGAFLIVYFRKERDSLSYDLLVDGWSMWVLLLLQLGQLLIR
jgi:4-hydroxybenzoate polyprenyltransferase